MSLPIRIHNPRQPTRPLAVMLVPTLAMILAGSRVAAEDQAGNPPAQTPTQPTGSATPAAGQSIQVQADTKAGPTIAPSGANSYGVTDKDIENMPSGSNSYMTDVLAQMPGVAIDQYQMVHIRDNEGAGFQYQINGILVPIDINTNPPFLSMINPMFVDHMELLDGVLPARYSYAVGGVVDIQSKDGFGSPGGTASTMVGQRDTIQENIQYGGSSGKFSYYINAMAGSNHTAFSSATAGANAIHDHQDVGQAFGYFSYLLTDTTKLGLILSTSASNNQFPNVPDLQPQYALAGVTPPNSADINSGLNMRDYLGILSLNGKPSEDVSYDVAFATHSISQKFIPDNEGELIYQGVSSTVKRSDLDYTLQGNVAVTSGKSIYTTGFYAGAYGVTSKSSSLVFPVDGDGNQTSDVPVEVDLSLKKTNIVTGLYLNDEVKLTKDLSANLGIRWDTLSGFTSDSRFDPTLSMTYKSSPNTVFHAGFAQYMQVPTFSGISTSAPAAYAGTTGAEPAGGTYPLAEHDDEFDAGVRYRPFEGASIYWDSFFEITHHYLDAGLFGDVPIYSPLNYDKGYIWDSELGMSYRQQQVTGYLNFTIGRNYQKGVASGQFNFDDPVELAYINSHYFLLDHEPLAELNDGLTYYIHPVTLSLDSVYSSGLRGGFADYERLPSVFQVNASIMVKVQLPGVGEATNRLTLLNLFNRVNLIRPANGIGVFQASYGPRFTVYDTVTIPF